MATNEQVSRAPPVWVATAKRGKVATLRRAQRVHLRQSTNLPLTYAGPWASSPRKLTKDALTSHPDTSSMPSPDQGDDVFGSSSRFLAPARSSPPRKSPSKQSLSMSRHRSTNSLRGAPNLADEEGANGRHSLAHELAVALLPEPSAGSKMLAEEFGIEYDEGAEGIDGETAPAEDMELPNGMEEPTFADADASMAEDDDLMLDAPPDDDPTFGSPTPAARTRRRPEQDAMAVLAQDLESTDKFLAHLRRLDADGNGSGGALERAASDVIRRIEETARDREGQVRALLEYEREFRKIGGEVGGGDALAALETLAGVDALALGEPAAAGDAPRAEGRRALDRVVEESQSGLSNDWEVDPDRNLQMHMGEHDDEDDEPEPDSASPTKDSFVLPPVPTLTGPPTPAQTLPQLAHFRAVTGSLVVSLTAISEHAQVTGAATTEAGRKIRALKNKLGGWRTDWDSAERSRVRIERWEAGLPDDAPPGATPTKGARRIDGRKLVEEHLRAFESALAEANVKTQAIMAAS